MGWAARELAMRNEEPMIAKNIDTLFEATKGMTPIQTNSFMARMLGILATRISEVTWNYALGEAKIETPKVPSTSKI